MNRLSTDERAKVLGCLVEGMSIRARVRVAGVAKNTIAKLLVDLGRACSEYQDRVLRDLSCERLRLDEIWSYSYARQKNAPEEPQGEPGYGDIWTWVALDSETKLVPSFLVGTRTLEVATAFVSDLASRVKGHVRLTTEGPTAYLDAVDQGSGPELDYAVLQRVYGRAPEGQKPDKRHIWTSHAERQNQTSRTGVRRFTRLTSEVGKKAENLAAAVSLHLMYYNFARPQACLSDPCPRTPAMAAGVASHQWTLRDIAALLDAS